MWHASRRPDPSWHAPLTGVASSMQTTSQIRNFYAQSTGRFAQGCACEHCWHVPGVGEKHEPGARAPMLMVMSRG